MRVILISLVLVGLMSTVCFAGDDNRIWESERSDYRDEVTGTEVWRLTADPEVEIIPDRIKDPWSPDGSQILFRSKRIGAWHLFVMAADGSKMTRVTDRKGPAVYGVWSRSGRKIVCTPLVKEKYELQVIDVTTYASRRIAGPFESQLNKMGVSPDGESVLFTRVIKPPDGDKQDVVMSSFVNMDGTGFFDFTGETKHGRIGWIPGRMDIRRMKSSRQQYIVQPDGSGGERLIGEGGHEYFTPNGRHILICDAKGGDPSKWLGECSAGIYTIETGRRRDVTKELMWLGSHPAISPDGRFVAADNAGHCYPGAIVIVSLDGSVPLRVLCYHHASWESGHITHPTVHWSPDGTKLLFISDKDSPDKKKGDMYLAVVKQPDAPRHVYVNNRADGPSLTWRPSLRHVETKEYVVMRSLPSPRPNLQGKKLDRTGVFEEIGVVPVVSALLTGKHIDANAKTLTVSSTAGFPNSGELLIAGNHSMAAQEIVSYRSKTETSFLIRTRGTEGSEEVSHWAGARVWSLSAMRFTDKVPDPKRQYYYTVRAREHSGLTSPYSRISNPAVTKP